MTLIYKQGDLLDAPEPIIIHGCNAMGVMGSGVARAIREKWPKAYTDYKYIYDVEGLSLGQIVWTITDGKYIANAITQKTYGRSFKRYVNYDAIETVFDKVRNEIESNTTMTAQGPPYVAIPKIGAGLGGLGGGDWSIISEIIDSVMYNYDIVVYEI
jgi:O-acetyl-ADP-ribose deacetylase (regulator of RNase III)